MVSYWKISVVWLLFFRSVSAVYEQNMDLKGIEVYRYILHLSTLASPLVNPDNWCFCRSMKTTRNCTMAGVLDLSSCQQGQFAPLLRSNPDSTGSSDISGCSSVLFIYILFSHCFLALWTGRPVYISLPHFLHGSPFLREDVLGLSPSEEHHKTFFDVEPVRASKCLAFSFSTFDWSSSDVTFLVIFPPDHWVYIEVCQENSSEYDVWAIKNHHVSCVVKIRLLAL